MPGRLRAFDHKLAYDGVRDRVVLFGGVSVTTCTSTCMARS